MYLPTQSNSVIEAAPSDGSLEIWSVGHSTRREEEFLELLLTHGIEALADVRQFPGSRKYPQYNKENLSDSLGRAGIEYFHFAELGGRRKTRADSRNTAWRNDSFRAYADYMETSEFKAGIDHLLELSTGRRIAVMCAEAVWWRCHRGLISDYLKARGHKVMHIHSRAKSEEHPYTSAAKIINGELSYRLEDLEPSLFDQE